MALSELELGWKSSIPHPGYNPDGESRAFYSLYYNYHGRNRKNNILENREDSPDESRRSLLRRVYPFISSLPKESFVLDLGAGRQIFEKEYEDKYGNKPICHIITVDIADIPKDRLLAKDCPHVQATGQSLPFRDEQFDAVISNMAFDFMLPLPQATTELYRITKGNASIFLNLHHPSLVNYDIDRELSKVARKMRHKHQNRKTNNEKLRLKTAVFLHHKHLRDNRLLFETDDQIVRCFSDGGFDIKSIEIKSDSNDKWWEVDLAKKTMANKKHLEPSGTIFTRQP